MLVIGNHDIVGVYQGDKVVFGLAEWAAEELRLWLNDHYMVITGAIICVRKGTMSKEVWTELKDREFDWAEAKDIVFRCLPKGGRMIINGKEVYK